MIEVLKDKILNSKNKSISYSEFMETVLYHPTKGYYMKGQQKIGKEGDFYTSSSIHGVFGKLFAKFFMKIIKETKLPPIVCEVGAGNGSFAKSVLDEWEKVNPEQFSKLTYHIVESSPYHRELQAQMLPIGSQVRQWSSMEELQAELHSFVGILYSNELFDAFPVDVLQKHDDDIYEVKIGLNEVNELVEVFHKCKNEQLINWYTQFVNELRDGQRIEIPLQMTKWIESTATWIESGYLVTIDYGYTREEWSESIHRNGSLRGYHKHELVENPLLYPGEMDLTTHIHLDAVREIGEKNGLDFKTMMPQHEFLVQAGILEYLQENYDPNPFSHLSKQNRAIHTLITQGGVSSSFQVILQQKGMEGNNITDLLIRNNTPNM